METPKGLAMRLCFLQREKLKSVIDGLFESLSISVENLEDQIDEILFGYVR